MNNINVFNHTTLNNLNFSNASYDFIATSNATQICFDFVCTMNPFVIYLAPCLDNITIEIPVSVASNTSNSSSSTNASNSSNSNSSTNASNSTNTNPPTNNTITPPQNTTLNQTSTDNLTLDISQFQLTKQALLAASIVVSLPLKAITSLRCAYLVLDDVWLYDYSKRNFTGLIETIFVTITNIQLVKF